MLRHYFKSTIYVPYDTSAQHNDEESIPGKNQKRRQLLPVHRN